MTRSKPKKKLLKVIPIPHSKVEPVYEDPTLLALEDVVAGSTPPTEEDRDDDLRIGLGSRPRVSRQQMMVREAFVEQLVMRGASSRAIVEAAKSKLGITKSQTLLAVTKVKERWRVEYDTDRAYWKLAAIKRIQQSINRLMAGKPASDGLGPPKVEHALVLKYEQFLSDLQGTKDPIKIDLASSFNEAIVGIVGGMTEEQITQLAAEYDENERLANLARRTLPAGVIDTTGEEIVPGFAQCGRPT